MRSYHSSLALATLLPLITSVFGAAIKEHALQERQPEKGFEAIPDWLNYEVFSKVDIEAESLAKRQQPGAECYPDAWLSIIESAAVATPFCSSFINLPAATQYDATTVYRSGILNKRSPWTSTLTLCGQYHSYCIYNHTAPNRYRHDIGRRDRDASSSHEKTSYAH